MARRRGRSRRGTPERNALHVLFQEKSYCIAFIETACPDWMSFLLDNIKVSPNPAIKREEELAQATLVQAEQRLVEAQKAYEAKYLIQRWIPWSRAEVEKHEQNVTKAKQKVAECKQKVAEGSKEFDIIRRSLGIGCDCKPNLVSDKVDVEISCEFTIVAPPQFKGRAYWKTWSQHDSRSFHIQVEPSVSDGYREILAQMQASGGKYLFLDSYQGQGATQEQFEALFRSAGIMVVYKHSVDATAARLSSLDSRPFPHSAIRFSEVDHRRTADPRWMKLCYRACASSAPRSVLSLVRASPF